MKSKNSVRLSELISLLFSLIIFPLIIFWLAFTANSFHGVVDPLECGQYLSCINGVFHNKIPYKDFVPPVGPLFIWVLSGFLSILGKTLHNLRLYFHLSTISVYIILYFLGLKLYRFKIFAYILPVIALVETFNPFWSSRWAGYSRFGAGLLGLFFMVLYVKNRKPLYLILSGVIAGLSLLYSIDSGIFLIICLILLCCLMAFYKPPETIPKRKEEPGYAGKVLAEVRHVAIPFFSGLLLSLLFFVLYMAFNKALFPYLKGMYLTMSHHVGAWQTAFPGFIKSLNHYNNLWLFFKSDEFRIYMPRIFYFFVTVYIIYAFKRNRNVIDCIIIPLITFYGILTYKSGSRVLLGPQFDAGIIPVFLLFIYFIEKGLIFLIFNRRNFIKKRRPKPEFFYEIVSLTVIIILSSYIITSQKRVYGTWVNWFRYQRHKANIMPVYNFIMWKGNMKLITVDLERIGPIQVEESQAQEIRAVTSYIKNNTSKDEAIFTFPEHGLYNFLADRPGVTRFYTAIYAYTVDEWRKEILNDLKQKPPRYVIYAHRLSYAAKNMGMEEELLPEVIAFITQNYSLEKKIGQIGIYRIKS